MTFSEGGGTNRWCSAISDSGSSVITLVSRFFLDGRNHLVPATPSLKLDYVPRLAPAATGLQTENPPKARIRLAASLADLNPVDRARGSSVSPAYRKIELLNWV